MRILLRPSPNPNQEAKFFGTLETLLGNCSTHKYEGGEIVWKNPPIIFIVSNGRPLEERRGADGWLLRDYVPVCFLSAHRIIGQVFTVREDGGRLELVQAFALALVLALARALTLTLTLSLTRPL
jgi:hypothetical protein